MKKLKKEKYAHEKIQESYKNGSVLPTLAHEKHVRKELKDLHRPIRRDELDDHERAYQEAKRAKDKQKRIQRERWYAEIGYGVDRNTYKYKNKYMERVLDEDKIKKEERRRKSE